MSGQPPAEQVPSLQPVQYYGGGYYGQPYQHPFPTDPADAPTRGASFGGALALFFRKYARFTGRASQSEFWWMFLWNAILSMLITIVVLVLLGPVFADLLQYVLATRSEPIPTEVIRNFTLSHYGELVGVWVVAGISTAIGLAVLVPSLALTVRRLHDANLSGHFAWLYLVPSVGHLVVLVLCILNPNPLGQRFDRPLAGAA